MRLLLLTFLIIFLSCSNQKYADCNYIIDYYPNTAEAEIQFYEGNYEVAFKLYEKIFRKCEAIKLSTHHDTDNFAKICAELDKPELALEYIEKSILKGATLKEFLDDSTYSSLFETKEGQQLISNYSRLREEYLDKLNLRLRAELQDMIKLDRQYNMTRFQDSMFSVNDQRLYEIFEQYGFPNDQIIGNYGVDQTRADPTILLLHTSDSIRENYFIPKMKEMVKSGQCSPLTLGMVLDNLALFNNQPQTHGTYRTKNGRHAVMITDTSDVDANRKEIGLPPLKIAERLDSLKMKYFGISN